MSPLAWVCAALVVVAAAAVVTAVFAFVDRDRTADDLAERTRERDTARAAAGHLRKRCTALRALVPDGTLVGHEPPAEIPWHTVLAKTRRPEPTVVNRPRRGAF